MQNNRGLVLIIEDDKDISASVVDLLTDEGYETATAFNGAEGLRRLEEGLRPQLILLDLMMPIMDGFGFRNEQRKNPEWGSIPVIVMSADGNVTDKKAKAEAAAYLKKPLDIVELIEFCERYKLPN